MRKIDIVTRIADHTGIPKADVVLSLEQFFKEVKSSLIKGENVYVRGFGSFIVKKRAKKLGRNIKRGTTVVIPEHYIPAFKPAKVFLDAVKKGDAPVKKSRKSANG